MNTEPAFPGFSLFEATIPPFLNLIELGSWAGFVLSSTVLGI